MAIAKRILIPRIKCIRTVYPPICIWKPRCWLCTKAANKVTAKKSKLKTSQRRTNLRSVQAELKREKEEIANDLAGINGKNHDLKNKIITHYNRCTPCRARYAKIAVASYRRYKSTPREGRGKQLASGRGQLYVQTNPRFAVLWQGPANRIFQVRNHDLEGSRARLSAFAEGKPLSNSNI